MTYMSYSLKAWIIKSKTCKKKPTISTEIIKCINQQEITDSKKIRI